MKVTVVTPLFRVHNVGRLHENIGTVLRGMDWQWLVVLDETSPEAADIEGFTADDNRILNRRYHGGDRWKAAIARNMATEIEDGWIVNLDDDCLLHDNAGLILKMVSPDMHVVAWQTIDQDGGIRNYPNASKSSGTDTNAFAYRRPVMDQCSWEVRDDNDVFYFANLRERFRIAYFQVPGAWWNVNP